MEQCDEARPICNQCATRGRPCVYTDAASMCSTRVMQVKGTGRGRMPLSCWRSRELISSESRVASSKASDGLTLRSTRLPAGGYGAFHTFYHSATTSEASSKTSLCNTPSTVSSRNRSTVGEEDSNDMIEAVPPDWLLASNSHRHRYRPLTQDPCTSMAFQEQLDRCDRGMYEMGLAWSGETDRARYVPCSRLDLTTKAYFSQVHGSHGGSTSTLYASYGDGQIESAIRGDIVETRAGYNLVLLRARDARHAHPPGYRG